MNKHEKNDQYCSFRSFYIYVILFITLLFVTNFLQSCCDISDTVKFPLVPVAIEMILGMFLFTSVIVCYFYNIVRMWKNIKLETLDIFKFFLGPWMLLPQAMFGTVFILSVYPRPMETGIFDKFLFFQGSIDMGCELIFVATIALYILLGFTASWYTVLKLEELDVKTSLFKMFRYSFFVLKYHILVFILWNINNSCDARVVPNDFRNMFLLVFLLYFLSIVLIVIMHKLNVPRIIRLIFAPTFIVLWLIIGSDGNTARAKQVPIWKDNPHYVVTSKKHAVMIAWHNLCDDFFGDPKPNYTYQYEK